MREGTKSVVTFLLTVVIASGFYVGLYFYDNKYTHASIQPANGLLALSTEDLDKDPVLFLVKGWAYYPGVILSPEDFIGGNPANYMVYASIGEHTRFDNIGTKKDPYGSGTYRLNLRLPQEESTYALELPEIFSAYNLYINDKLVLKMGEPDPINYKPSIQNRILTFEASGKATIMLAASNYSHYYSGLVYPPSFGLPSGIIAVRDMRLSICLFIVIIGIIGAAFSLYFGLRLQHRNAILFSLLCATMCGFTSYSLVHTGFALGVFPWYTLELLWSYLLTLLVVMLHNRICNVDYHIRRISVIMAILFCVIVFCYGLFSAKLTIPMMELFSYCISLFKTVVAGYLLVTAWLSLKSENDSGGPLFYASLFYAASFVWDRILPTFEPVLCGWFSEWGSLVVVLAIGYTLWCDIISSYTYSLAFAEEHRQITRQLAMQTEYARQISQHSEENKRITHDFRHHLRIITGLACQIKSGEERAKPIDELLAYLEQVAQNAFISQRTLAGTFSKNTAVDALLQYYYTIAEEQHIKGDFHLALPENLPFTDVELCTILGNLLENAVEACGRKQGDHQRISFFTKTTDCNFIICLENTYDGSILEKDGRFLSRKSGEVRYGIGLESVREIVEHHGGQVYVYPMEYIFRIVITLPVLQSEKS